MNPIVCHRADLRREGEAPAEPAQHANVAFFEDSGSAGASPSRRVAVVYVLGCAMVLLATPIAFAQPSVQVVKMTVAAAKLPTPAMKYHLFPELRELKAGNAAVFYQRSQSAEWWTPAFRQEIEKLHEALEQPWESAFAEKYAYLSRGGPLDELDAAARCASCDWQMLDRLRAKGPLILIPDVHGMRSLGRLNAGRARVEIHRGEFDQAVHSLQSGFALSKHVGEAPLLINAYVGLGIANVTLSRVEEFMQQPKAPNLYWAMTDLPQPFLDLRRPLQSERVMIDAIFPEIRKALDSGKPAAIAGETLRRGLGKLAMLDIDSGATGMAILVAQDYPAARAYFLRQGHTETALDALPVTQVVLMHQYAQYDRWSDAFYKLNNVPYWEAVPRWKQLEKDFDREVRTSGALALLTKSFNWPNVVSASRARLHRRIALLRCVEAMRHYAARKGDRLPAALDRLVDTPIPLDPITGQAFAYRLENEVGILESSAAPAVRIEIQLSPSSSK